MKLIQFNHHQNKKLINFLIIKIIQIKIIIENEKEK